jgi:hypothetical protein
MMMKVTTTSKPSFELATIPFVVDGIRAPVSFEMLLLGVRGDWTPV